MLAKAIFSRTNLILIYFAITVITCFQAMFKSSFAVGGGALVACALCFFAVATLLLRSLRDTKKDIARKNLLESER